MTQPDLRLHKLTKRFGTVSAVDDISLDVAPGRFVTIVGPSGCGKTTLLRLIAGFERPDAGTISVRGVNVLDIPPHQRETATVFQDFALFPRLTVAENVTFGLHYRRTDRAARDRIAVDTLDLIGLAGYGPRRPHQLSGGQQQRVALGRAMAIQPDVLLLDEPLGSLDIELRRQLQVELRRIQRASATTFVATTHDLVEALTWSDQIAVMRSGCIEQTGSPEYVFERPVSRFVAGFLGYRSIFDVTVLGSDASSTDIRLGASPLTVPVGGYHVGEKVGLTIRPERIALADPGTTAFDGRVVEMNYTGTHRMYVVESAVLGTVVVAQPSDATTFSATIGDLVALELPPAALRLLRS